MDSEKRAPSLVRLVSATVTFVCMVLFLNVVMRHGAEYVHGSIDYTEKEFLLISSLYFGVFYLAFVIANLAEKSMKDRPVGAHLKLTVMAGAVAYLSFLL